jgi:hypothetical protein
MTTTTLYRLSAACLIASFALSLAGGMLHPVVDGQSHSVETFLAPRSPEAQYLIYAGAVLLMLGLPGAYAFFRQPLGRTGFVGMTLYMVGNALSAMAHLVVEAFVGPALAADPDARHLVPESGAIVDSSSFLVLQSVGGLVLVGGLLVTGVAIIRAPGLPTWVGVLTVVGAVAVMVPFPEREVLTGLLVELPRGTMVATLAVLMLRALRVPERDRERHEVLVA